MSPSSVEAAECSGHCRLWSLQKAAVAKQLTITIVDKKTFSTVVHAKNLPNSAKGCSDVKKVETLEVVRHVEVIRIVSSRRYSLSRTRCLTCSTKSVVELVMHQIIVSDVVPWLNPAHGDPQRITNAEVSRVRCT